MEAKGGELGSQGSYIWVVRWMILRVIKISLFVIHEELEQFYLWFGGFEYTMGNSILKLFQLTSGEN